MTLTDILKAAADGPDAVTALCTDMTDDALRAEIVKVAAAKVSPRSAAALSDVRPWIVYVGADILCDTAGGHRRFVTGRIARMMGDRAIESARGALVAELARRTALVDPGWECERCGHVNPDDVEHCAGEKCVAFREWAATQPQEDQ